MSAALAQPAASAGSNSFVQRAIDVTINIGKGTNGEDGFDSYSYSGLRVSTQIVLPGGVFSSSSATATIYGLSLNDLNTLSSLGLSPKRQRRNTIEISAGDSVSGMGTVFIGSIVEAYADFEGAPDSAFFVQSLAGGLQKLKPIPPTSFKGAVDVATVMQSIASQIGYNFENSGVSVILRDPYFCGTAFDQIHTAAQAADINVIFDHISAYTIAIWPKGKYRNNNGGPKPLISPATGLVGYPSFASPGVILKTIYNPAVLVGGLINVQSQITAACGDWGVFTMSHSLESQTQNGDWYSTIWANNIDQLSGALTPQ